MKGQALMEYILLLVVIVTAWLGISKALRNNGVFQTVFGDPWTRLATTIELGIPASATDRINAAKSHHPSQIMRHATPKAQ